MIDFKSKEFRLQQRKTDFVDKDLELTVTSGLLSIEGADHLMNNFDSEYISSDYVKTVFDIIMNAFQEDSIILDSNAFENSLKGRASQNNKLLTIWKKIKKRAKKTTFAEVVTGSAKLYDLYKARVLSIGLKNVANNLKQVAENGDTTKISQAEEQFNQFSTYVETSKTLKSKKVDMIDAYEEWKRAFKYKQKHPEELKGVETGIPEIDRQMPPLKKGELGCIAGPSSGGKSIMAMHFGLYNWKTTGDTVTVTIEMSEEKYRERQYCHLSGIDYNSFARYDLTPKQWNHLDRTVERFKKNKNKSIIIDMPEGCSVKSVKREFELAMKGTNTTLGIIDYMNIMCGPNGKISFDWENQLSIAAETKLLIARKLSLPIWTPIQTDGKNGEAFSKHIKDQLDVGLMLHPDDNTKETGIMPITWFKTREFLGMPFSIETDRGKMRFSALTEAEEKHMAKVNRKKKTGTIKNVRK